MKNKKSEYPPHQTDPKGQKYKVGHKEGKWQYLVLVIPEQWQYCSMASIANHGKSLQITANMCCRNRNPRNPRNGKSWSRVG